MAILMAHRIVYPDGSEEVITHYGIFAHSSGGFAFYQEPQDKPNDMQYLCSPYIFISGANVRKIIPMGAV